MYGSRSIQRTTLMSKWTRFELERGQSTFVPVVPRGSLEITDILLHRPYVPGERVTVEFFNDDSERIGRYTNLLINKMHEVRVVASGQVPVIAYADIPEIVIFYRQLR